jgi:hypothetical protein
VPLAWRCDEADLGAVPGVGPVRAATLWHALPPLAGEAVGLFGREEVA